VSWSALRNPSIVVSRRNDSQRSPRALAAATGSWPARPHARIEPSVANVYGSWEMRVSTVSWTR
jgi:hypothetical protein